ncbi:MAG: lipopolysaccharide heptosyltransferase II [Planctomycetota bacterium]
MKILLFCPNWIGDVVMATPAIRAIRRLHPDGRLVGIMRPYVSETLAGNPWLDDVILYDHKSADRQRGTWAVLSRLREEQYDVGVLFTNSLRSALLAWGGAIRQRVGYAREGRGILLNDSLKIRRSWHGYQPSPVIDYYLALAYHLGAASESYQMELFTRPEDESRADEIWKKFGFQDSERVIALNPGAAFGSAKRWPSTYFAELARMLVDQAGVKVLVLCGPSERGFARFISDGACRPRMVKSLAEEDVSIGLTKAIMRRMSLLVTTDSGPRHFGAAFGIPVVSLFGPTHIEWTDTHYAGEKMLQKKLDCGPCQQRVCPLGHLQCMKELTVDQVFAAAMASLSTSLPILRSA